MEQATSFTKTPSSSLYQYIVGAKTPWRFSRVKPIIDLRSEDEFAQGHIPGAINLPLLDNAERREVGICYKEKGKSEAVSLGLAFVSNKISELAARLTPFQNQQVLLYCYRGGMRSGAAAQFAKCLSVKPQVLSGGYKAYRKDVLTSLSTLAENNFLVLDGLTGVGKTDFVREFANLVPTLDFEGLAGHRGSAFGAIGLAPPKISQQGFENALINQFMKLRGPESSLIAREPILVEIENSLGPVRIPLKLQRKIHSAPTMLLTRDFEDRVARIVDEYAPSFSEELIHAFEQQMQLVKKFLSRQIFEEILKSARNSDFSQAVRLLLMHRYDRVYIKGIDARASQAVASFNLTRDMPAAKEFVLEHFRKYQDSVLERNLRERQSSDSDVS